MIITPTIVSPGVELVEYDESVRASVPTGTTIVICGFAQMGPVSEVTSLSSMDDFESMFGKPTNPAEQYFYKTTELAMASAAKVNVIRLPYGLDSGDTKSANYTILAYPAIGYTLATTEDGYGYKPIKKYTDGSTLKSYNQTDYPDDYNPELADSNERCEGSATFLIGEPVQFTINLEQYYKFLAGQSLTESGKEFIWDENIPVYEDADGSFVNELEKTTTGGVKYFDLADLNKYAFISLNVGNTVTNDNYNGYYMALSDNAFSDPGSQYAAVRQLKTVTKLPEQSNYGLTALDYTIIPTDRLDFKLSSDQKGCISQIMQESINNFDISGTQWNDTLNFGIFKIREATGTGDALKLAALITNAFNASLEYNRKTTSKYSTAPVDFFAENVSKTDGGIIQVFVNTNLSGALTSRGLYADGSPKIKIRVLAQQLNTITKYEAKESITGVKYNAYESFNFVDTNGARQYRIVDIMNQGAGISTEVVNNILSTNGPFKPADALYPLGLYAKSNNAAKLIGNVPAKIKDALDLISNEELYDCDVLVEGGLGTIYVGAQDAMRTSYLDKWEKYKKDNPNATEEEFGAAYPDIDVDNRLDRSASIFDDTKLIRGASNMRTGSIEQVENNKLAQDVIMNFRSVQSQFLALACSQQDGGRGDCFFIGDSLRQISVEGKDTKIQSMFKLPIDNDIYTAEYVEANGQVNHSFSTSIYWALRHLWDAVTSSYMAIFPHFIKVADLVNGTQIWIPSSGAIAGCIGSVDASYGPWQAPAGITNGVLTSVLDISFTTNQRQRDDLYKISLNSLVKNPTSGHLIWGIRTMIKKDSSFDQLTCRRTFLYMEKILRATAKNYLFEGNTDFTRLSIVTTLTPVFDNIVTNRGIYEYVLICDERNNPSDVIDNGNLQIDFYASAVRTAERILIGVHATKSGTIVTEFDQ